MKNTVVFGSGQIGTKLARLLAGEYRVICFADNSPARQHTVISGIPVVSPEESLQKNPACVCIGVLDGDRSQQMEKQLRDLGFQGEILRPREMRVFDPRVATMRLLAERLNRNRIPGETAELGVYKGDFAQWINAAFCDRELHLYDTFAGFSETDIGIEKKECFSGAETGDFSGVTEAEVLAKMPYRENVRIHKGHFPEIFQEKEKAFCFVSLDADLYEPTGKGLEIFWPRLAKGGVIMLHDYDSLQFQGAGKAADEFLEKTADAVSFPVCDLHGSLVILKI